MSKLSAFLSKSKTPRAAAPPPVVAAADEKSSSDGDANDNSDDGASGYDGVPATAVAAGMDAPPAAPKSVSKLGAFLSKKSPAAAAPSKPKVNKLGAFLSKSSGSSSTPAATTKPASSKLGAFLSGGSSKPSKPASKLGSFMTSTASGHSPKSGGGSKLGAFLSSTSSGNSSAGAEEEEEEEPAQPARRRLPRSSRVWRPSHGGHGHGHGRSKRGARPGRVTLTPGEISQFRRMSLVYEGAAGGGGGGGQGGKHAIHRASSAPDGFSVCREGDEGSDNDDGGAPSPTPPDQGPEREVRGCATPAHVAALFEEQRLLPKEYVHRLLGEARAILRTEPNTLQLRVGPSSDERDTFHPGTACDGCSRNPLRGTRWRCRDCPRAGPEAFDLCGPCHADAATRAAHAGGTHAFVADAASGRSRFHNVGRDRRGGQLTVVGDIHGQYFDMQKILAIGGAPGADVRDAVRETEPPLTLCHIMPNGT